MKPIELVVFKSGNSSAVRLPKSFGFEPGQKLAAFLEGEALVLKHTDANGWPLGYFDSWEASEIELPERSSQEGRISRLFGSKGSL